MEALIPIVIQAVSRMVGGAILAAIAVAAMGRK